jgi:hypothetical protein
MTTTTWAGWCQSRLAFSERPLNRLRLGYAAWLFGVFCYFLPAATWSPVSRFDLTRAIVESGSFSIDAYADNTGDRARSGEHWYSDKAPLVALLAIPAYQTYHWLDRSRGKAPAYEARGSLTRPALRVTVNRSFQRALYVCSLSTAALSGVALGLFLFELLRRRMAAATALWGSALTVLCTPIFPYATSLYGHVSAGAFLAGGLFFLDGLFTEARAELPEGQAAPTRRAALAGACLAASVGCEYLAAVPVLALLIGFCLGKPPRQWAQIVLGLALGALGPTLLIAGYHWVCFGAPWRTGYSFIVDPTFAAGHASGMLGIRVPRLPALWGLLFGRLRGLFYIAPLALPLLVGVFCRARGGDRTALAGAFAFLALLLVNSSYYMWWGGAAAAPRHLIPVLGTLALGFPWVWQRRAWRYALLGLAVISVCNMLAISAVGLEAPERGDVLVDFVYARLLQGRLSAMNGASNLGIELGIVRGGTLGPLLVWLMAGAYVLRRQIHELTPSPEPARV